LVSVDIEHCKDNGAATRNHTTAATRQHGEGLLDTRRQTLENAETSPDQTNRQWTFSSIQV